MIPFNKAAYLGSEQKYILESITSHRISGDNKFTKLCEKWFETNLPCKKSFLTTSCTHSLEMSGLLANIQSGDEVIMPSFTFVSTANAFVLRGAKIIFVDIRPDTLNIDEQKIEQAITNKTKVIVVVHYAGVSCEMDKIMELAQAYKLIVIEDAAQAIMSKYKGKALGTIGHLGAFSFHETKNITSAGEGGLLIVNEDNFIERAEILREKGTNRAKFFRGEIDKYTWVDLGSSYLLNDVSAAYLWAQLEKIDEIITNRFRNWNLYYQNLSCLADKGYISLPYIPSSCEHNAHIFYIKVKDLKTRNHLLTFLKEKGVIATFHYVPLHSSPAGKKFGEFRGEDLFTTRESERLVRLPLYYNMPEEYVYRVCELLRKFFTS
ncbi:MAG: dTDP-4-amino-4,6-dideoxygalactose transaminase [Desulfonauticus sp.]|nr:dTDP-4-amino-4,6-dideoxygalactose transaminase [Desulfonauticus sp.]